MVVAGEEEYETEIILKHKGEDAPRLYLVMSKGCFIIKDSYGLNHICKYSFDPRDLLALR